MRISSKKFIILLPTLVVILGILFLTFSLEKKENYVAPSALQGKVMPSFALPALHEDEQLTEHMLFYKTKGEFTLLNVWASWCVVCKTEHEFLLKLKQKNNIDIIGLNYRDLQKSATSYLQKSGNPYRKVIFDHKGVLALDLGVIATPETYLVDNQGIIQFRYTGALNEQIWQTKFVPLIAKLTAIKQGAQ